MKIFKYKNEFCLKYSCEESTDFSELESVVITASCFESDKNGERDIEIAKLHFQRIVKDQ